MGSAGTSVTHLIDTHYESLYRYAFRLSGSSTDAEDLTQEAFTKALTNLSQLREADNAKAWLFRIVRNEFLHKIRDDRRHQTLSTDVIGEIPSHESSENEDLSAFDRETDPILVQKALDELNEGFRTPLILYFFEDFSYRDIAEQMDLPIGTVMSRLARGKSHLRRSLSKRFSRPESCEHFEKSAHQESEKNGLGLDRTDPRNEAGRVTQ